MNLTLLIFVPVLIALANYLCGGKATRIVAGILQTAVFVYCLRLFTLARFYGQEYYPVTGSSSFLGIPLVLNRLSALFILLASFIFTVAFLYTLTRETAHRLYVFLLFSLQALTLAAFLSDDIFNVYLVLEISSLLCSMLILYNRPQRSLYDGLVYLLTNMVGMLFFLMGIGYLYKLFGTLNITQLTAAVKQIGTAKTLALPYAFIMTGITLKCAFMPLHGWLPKAHGTPGAPAVVSAILSGIYVKCGIYLFMRLRLLFLPHIQSDAFFLATGIITGIAGIVFALLQTDIKLILAYHTISQMGLILIGISLGSDYALAGGILHIVNHALFKSLLFLCAGMIIKKYGTRMIFSIHGVFKTMPAVSVSLVAGILGITGAPFFNGSISKYFIQAGGTARAWWAETVIIIINTGTILSFVKFAGMLFGKPPENVLNHSLNTPKRAENPSSKNKPASGAVYDEASVSGELDYRDIPAVCAVFLLAAACLATGLFGQQFMNLTLGYAFSIRPQRYLLKAGIWLLSIGGGIALYTGCISRRAFFKRAHNPELGFGSMNLLTALFFAALLIFALFFQ